jgi:ribosomal protein S20
MPNTRSAKKALKSSLRKRQFNIYWKKKIKEVRRELDDNLKTKNSRTDILNKNLTALQKVLDKASKNNVIHQNKAKRLKSRYAKRISAQTKDKNTKAVSAKAGAGKATTGKKKSQP